MHHIKLNLDTELGGSGNNNGAAGNLGDVGVVLNVTAAGAAGAVGGLYWRSTPSKRSGGRSSGGGIAKTVPMLSTIEAIRLALLEFSACQQLETLRSTSTPGNVDAAGAGAGGVDAAAAGDDGIGDAVAGTVALIREQGRRPFDGLLFYLKLEALRRAQSIQQRLPPPTAAFV